MILCLIRQTFQIARRPFQISLAFLNLNQIRVGKNFRYRLIRYAAASGNVHKDKQCRISILIQFLPKCFRQIIIAGGIHSCTLFTFQIQNHCSASSTGENIVKIIFPLCLVCHLLHIVNSAAQQSLILQQCRNQKIYHIIRSRFVTGCDQIMNRMPNKTFFIFRGVNPLHFVIEAFRCHNFLHLLRLLLSGHILSGINPFTYLIRNRFKKTVMFWFYRKF